MRKQAEMSIEVKENGEYVEHIAYPYVEYDHVTFENGMQIEKALEDDVAMPTVAHDTSSFKVGQGDSDVSDSIVDSSIASMTIKGQTYQNILPSPTLRNSLTDGNTMQKINEGYDSVEVVDGNVKSAILKGQTLVNLTGKPVSVYKANTVDMVFIYENSPYPHRSLSIKPNTTYTIINFNEKKLSSVGLYTKEGDYVGALVVNGKSVVKHTTSETTEIISFMCRVSEGWTEEEILNENNIVLLEGDHTNVDIPYFEGMGSVKMPVLMTHNGNIMRMNPTKKWSNNNQNGCTMEEISPTDFIFTNKLRQQYAGFGFSIPLKEKFTVAFDYEKISGCNNYCEFQVFYGGGIPLGTKLTEQKGSVVSTYTVGRNTPVEIYFKPCAELESEDSILKITNLRWYIGDKVYEDKTNILSCNEEVILRGVGDVKDTLDLTTGELTQRIGELVLDGSQDGAYDYVSDESLGLLTIRLPKIPNIKNDGVNLYGLLSNKYNSVTNKSPNNIYSYNGRIMITKELSELESFNTSDKIKLFLSQNPITIQYPLAENTIKTVDLSILDQDNQPVMQLNSFANGYIQVSSQEGTLIPTTEYEVPTSNSYHADLMKPNAQYTMKNMQGTFTIDGIQYNASVNGTFTSPSALSNRLMITNVVQTQPMLLESDMTSEEVPYVEGIKSAFEGVDKVEIYSVGKNLFNGINIELIDNSYTVSNLNNSNYLKTDTLVEEGKQYTLSLHANISGNTGNVLSLGYMNYSNIVGGVERASHAIVAIDSVIDKAMSITFIAQKTDYVKIYIATGKTGYNAVLSDIQLEESPTPSSYKPHKSNVSKIPLLSPLRSLPNGVRDELILDRQNHKAKLIQRVGSIVLDGSEDEGWVNHSGTKYKMKIHTYGKNHGGTVNCISDTLIPQTYSNCILLNNIEGVAVHYDYLGINNHEFDKDLKVFKQWLSENPITIHYELETPIVTQVDIEGFPYVYKDGHIFLNTEVAPTTEVKYSINQSQIIESQSEDIVRHSKEIDNLYNLIATYVQVNYDSTLLNLKTKGV